MNIQDIKKKVELLEQQLFTATLDTYPKIAREYSFWAEKLSENDKSASRKKTEDSDDDNDEDGISVDDENSDNDAPLDDDENDE